jgi:hypothetical protein
MIKEFMGGMVSVLPFVQQPIDNGDVGCQHRDNPIEDWKAVGSIFSDIGKTGQNNEYKNDKFKSPGRGK